jgi:hypothetical protein
VKNCFAEANAWYPPEIIPNNSMVLKNDSDGWTAKPVQPVRRHAPLKRDPPVRKQWMIYRRL